MEPPDHPVTQLLAQWRAGSEEALSQLSAILYDELRVMAQRHLRSERVDHTIQRTALVNEAFVRLVAQQPIDWQNRAQFFALASTLMRRILVDHARARQADKRGGGVANVSLDELAGRHNEEADQHGALTPTALQYRETNDDVELIDAALTKLAAIDSQQAKIIEMRYFAGLTLEQTAEALGVSLATIKREWSMARAWLRCELEKSL